MLMARLLGHIVLGLPTSFGLYHLPDSFTDSLHGLLHPGEGGDGQLE